LYQKKAFEFLSPAFQCYLVFFQLHTVH
jgi:hypothetical protein